MLQDVYLLKNPPPPKKKKKENDDPYIALFRKILFIFYVFFFWGGVLKEIVQVLSLGVTGLWGVEVWGLAVVVAL